MNLLALSDNSSRVWLFLTVLVIVLSAVWFFTHPPTSGGDD